MTLFAAATPRVPTDVRQFVAVFVVREVEGGPEVYEGSGRYEILDVDGKVLELRQGDLIPFMSAPRKLALKDILDDALAAAKGTIP